MSYILDALKKSEEKRGTPNVPVDRPVSAPASEYGKRRFSLSIMFIVAALVAGWSIAQWQAPDEKYVPDIQTAAPAANTVVPLKTGKIEPEKNKPEMFEPEAIEPEVIEPENNQLETPFRLKSRKPERSSPVIHVEENRPVFRTVTPDSPVDGINSISPTNDVEDLTLSGNRTIQSRHELPIEVQQSIPDIKIEGHIYDVDPLARMVIINGKVRKEHQSISSGLSVQEVTADGVILNYQDTMFHMGVFD